MPYTKSRFRQFNSSVTMRIGGEVVNKINARYDYRCAECLGELDYWNNGLACKAAGTEHRYFVHKRDVPAIEVLRASHLNEVNANYEIIDGVLKPKKELIDAY
jgi:hypothetical protein